MAGLFLRDQLDQTAALNAIDSLNPDLLTASFSVFQNQSTPAATIEAAKQFIADGTLPAQVSTETPVEQFAWGAALAYASQSTPDLQEHPLWKMVEQSATLNREKNALRTIAITNLRNSRINIRWGMPPEGYPNIGFYYDHVNNLVNVDMVWGLIMGLEHARGPMMHEIGHGELSVSFSPRMVELAQRIDELSAKQATLTQDDYKEWVQAQLEWQLRNQLYQEAENNTVNHFATGNGQLYGQDIGYSLNTVQMVPPSTADLIGTNQAPWEREFLNLTQAVRLLFFQNNGLFEDSAEEWQKFDVDVNDIAATNGLGSGYTDVRRRILGANGIQYLQPKSFDRMLGPLHFAVRAEIDSAERGRLVDDLFDTYCMGFLAQAKAALAERMSQDEQFENLSQMLSKMLEQAIQEQRQQSAQKQQQQNVSPQKQTQSSNEAESEPASTESNNQQSNASQPATPDKDQGESQSDPEAKSKPDNSQANEQPDRVENGTKKTADEASDEKSQEAGASKDDTDGMRPEAEEQGEQPEAAEASQDMNKDGELAENPSTDANHNEETTSKADQANDTSDAETDQSDNEPSDGNSDNKSDTSSEAQPGQEGQQNGDNVSPGEGDPSNTGEPSEASNGSSGTEPDQDGKRDIANSTGNDQTDDAANGQPNSQPANTSAQNGNDASEQPSSVPSEGGQPGQEQTNPTQNSQAQNDGQPISNIGDLTEQLLRQIFKNLAEKMEIEGGEAPALDRPPQSPRKDFEIDSTINPDQTPSSLIPPDQIPELMNLNDTDGNKGGGGISYGEGARNAQQIDVSGGELNDYQKIIQPHKATVNEIKRHLAELEKRRYQHTQQVSKGFELLPEGGEVTRFNGDRHQDLVRKISSRQGFDLGDLERFTEDDPVKKILVPNTYIILIDTSGSMEGKPFDNAVAAAAVLFEATRNNPNAQTYIVAMGEPTPTVIARPKDNPIEVARRIAAIRRSVGGCKDHLKPALTKGLEEFAVNNKRRSSLTGMIHVFPCTDGFHNDIGSAVPFLKKVVGECENLTVDYCMITSNRNEIDSIPDNLDPKAKKRFGIRHCTGQDQIRSALLDLVRARLKMPVEEAVKIDRQRKQLRAAGLEIV